MDNRVFINLTCYSTQTTTSAWYIKNKNTGIGNILFQIASGLSYAKENNATLYVPSLNSFFKAEEIKKEDTIFKKINTDIVDGYNEIYYNFQNSYVFSLPFVNNIHFQGYLENYHNFHKNRSLILDYFRPSEEDKNYLYNKYPFIKNDNISSIHIRMGPDIKLLYPTNIINENIQSYYDLIDHMIIHKKINSFMVLTNDIEYSQKVLNCEKYKDIVFYYSDEKHAFYDLWIISLMKNNIISFSTLAAWGSYLNENEDKYIIGSKQCHRLTHHEWVYI
jgi:hypothetical protein